MNILTSAIFKNNTRIRHAVFNRHGGSGTAPFSSFNVSFRVKDVEAHVVKNRQKIKDALNIKTLISANQIHASDVFVLESKIEKDTEIDGFDALITNIPNMGLMIQQADCQAIMLYDPVQNVIANIHSGWKGSVLNIISKTIETMNNRFGTNPINLKAAISPSLGPCCAEFINYKNEFPPHLHKYVKKSNYFDFWEISQDQLITAGVLSKNIETARICTKCNDDFFSYRRQKVTGRFATVITLTNEAT